MNLQLVREVLDQQELVIEFDNEKGRIKNGKIYYNDQCFECITSFVQHVFSEVNNFSFKAGGIQLARVKIENISYPLLSKRVNQYITVKKLNEIANAKTCEKRSEN